MLEEHQKQDPFSTASTKHEMLPAEGDIVPIRITARFRRNKYVSGKPRRVVGVFSDHTKIWKVRVKMELVE